MPCPRLSENAWTLQTGTQEAVHLLISIGEEKTLISPEDIWSFYLHSSILPVEWLLRAYLGNYADGDIREFRSLFERVFYWEDLFPYSAGLPLIRLGLNLNKEVTQLLMLGGLEDEISISIGTTASRTQDIVEETFINFTGLVPFKTTVSSMAGASYKCILVPEIFYKLISQPFGKSKQIRNARFSSVASELFERSSLPGLITDSENELETFTILGSETRMQALLRALINFLANGGEQLSAAYITKTNMLLLGTIKDFYNEAAERNGERLIFLQKTDIKDEPEIETDEKEYPEVSSLDSTVTDGVTSCSWLLFPVMSGRTDKGRVLNLKSAEMLVHTKYRKSNFQGSFTDEKVALIKPQQQYARLSAGLASTALSAGAFTEQLAKLGIIKAIIKTSDPLAYYPPAAVVIALPRQELIYRGVVCSFDLISAKVIEGGAQYILETYILPTERLNLE